MENKQTLRKEISRIVEGDKETIVNEIHYKENLITENEINELMEQYEDYEEAYSVGLAIDFNEDLVWIDVNLLFEGLEQYIESCDEEDKESQRYEIFVELKKKLEDWKDFTIWL